MNETAKPGLGDTATPNPNVLPPDSETLDSKSKETRNNFLSEFIKKLFGPTKFQNRPPISNIHKVNSEKVDESTSYYFTVDNHFNDRSKQSLNSTTNMSGINIKKNTFSKKLVEFHLAEITILRQEILNIKDREVIMERFSSGATLTIFFLYLEGVLASAAALLIPVAFFTFGLIRAKEYARNIFEIDCYLREVELWFSNNGGWVNYFFRRRRMTHYFLSRLWYWKLALLASSTIFVLAWNPWNFLSLFGYFINEDAAYFVERTCANICPQEIQSEPRPEFGVRFMNFLREELLHGD